MARCLVGYKDHRSIAHYIEVEADSLYEAVALAVAEFREDSLIPEDQMPGALTEMTVDVQRPDVKHAITYKRVLEWAEAAARGGPAGILRRSRVRQLLGMEQQAPAD